ncbi:MAG: hypothetical protein DI539_29550 [Flavobacterium psychrophilum]|nr:MAG: hypothetical protein DI539_29550 [Flavobacterium psychrophilum]
MKYYIVKSDPEFTLFKVSNNSIEQFEKEYQGNILSFGESIMEALINFEKREDKSELELYERPVKYKTGGD